MHRSELELRSLIRENIENELRSAERATARQVAKVVKIAELLQQEIGRIDDPHAISPENYRLLNSVRNDVVAAFTHLDVGMPWKAFVRNGTDANIVLGSVYASNKDDAYEEALIRWGDQYPASKIDVRQEMLKR